MIAPGHKRVDKYFYENAQTIISETIAAVNPYTLIKDNVKLTDDILQIKSKQFDLTQYEKIHVLGCGKGSTFLFHGIKEILKERLCGGVIVSLPEHHFSDKTVIFKGGTHPVPDDNSQNAGDALISYCKNDIKKNDLVLFLLTGGASALMVHPYPPVTLAEKMEINKLLLNSGAEITEINCVRKHLSGIKGGRLAELIFPATVITLILSDIVDSPLDAIGSGPTIADPTTFSDAVALLKKYRLWSKITDQTRDFFNKGKLGTIAETPGPDSRIFIKNHNCLLADNSQALKAAKTRAEKLGLRTHILTSGDHGEASEVSKVYAPVMKEIIKGGNPFKPPVLLLAGGELTVTMRGDGKGGRNQEFVLSMLKEMEQIRQRFFIASVGTDGIDGPTDAAGAWIDEKTIKKVRAKKIDISDYLDNNDSYHFFKKIDQLIITGPTSTNVMDLRLMYMGTPDK